MSVEACKICLTLRSGTASGEEGFCTSCAQKLLEMQIAPRAARESLSRFGGMLKGDQAFKYLQAQHKPEKKSAPHEKKQAKKPPPPSSSSSAAPQGRGGLQPVATWKEHEVDALYLKRLKCPRLKIAVRANESGGFGDLINCLNTSHLLVTSKNAWRAYASCNHEKFDQMLQSFPKVRELPEAPGLHEEPAWVLLDVISKGGSVLAGSIDEYGYQTEKDARSAYCRGAGLAPHEMGIMINPDLREQLPLKQLRLAASGLQYILGKDAQVASQRLFFGYGAGQKEPNCFHALLDRVLFDGDIRYATVLPVGHGEGHLEGYLKNQERWKALNLGVPLPEWKQMLAKGREETADCTSLQLPLMGRAIRLVFPKKPLDYTDMLQLWRAADRSFTICEGDQSFSEAISARIPMAYQLWNPGSGGQPHKTRLFEDLLKVCEPNPKVVAFLKLAKDYGRKSFDPQTVKQIIQFCNTPQFLQDYGACMDHIAQHRNIAHALPGFVMRLWLRKVRTLKVAPELHSALDELFHLEDTRGSLGSIDVKLTMLHVTVKQAAARLTWSAEDDSYLRSSGLPRTDLNAQVASALAQVQVLLTKN